MGADVRRIAQTLAALIGELPMAERIEALNEARSVLAEVSPFSNEPVDLVQWVPAGEVVANSYNPNTVAPPEMELLRLSIASDGYTQPIVVNRESTGYEVVDGFHRSKVGREKGAVRDALFGHLPVVQLRLDRGGVRDRMAATIRHNRARGKHGIAQMSSIVMELTKRGWSSCKIGTELGMDPDEVLRLKQITGLAELFKDQEFSRAWEPRDDAE